MVQYKQYHGIGNFIFNLFLYTGMILVCVVTIYPFLNVLAISLNDSTDTVRGGIGIIPRVFTLDNYRRLFEFRGLIDAAQMSVIRTVVGTAVTVFSTTMVAYTMSRRDFMARKFVSILFVITMYVHGGIIPNFMLMRNLGLLNNFWVYIMPNVVFVWGLFIVRSYIDGLPDALQESARIDGANDLIIFLRVVLPLCVPVIATVTLFTAVFQWNSWVDTHIFASNAPHLSTLQYEMMKILTNVRALQQMAMTGDRQALEQAARAISPESIRMAMTIVATVPILMVYPFLQKYFVSGMVLGGVKG